MKMFFPWVLCCILILIVILLCSKIYLMKKSIREICTNMEEHFSNDTNTLLSVSSGDRHIRVLAEKLNEQLRILRRQRHQYFNGDRELKEAVVNISHDLRTPLTAIYGYLDLLEREEKSEAVESYIEIIRNRTEVLAKLTEELFKYSVIVATENDGAREEVVVNSVLEESIAAFYTALGERNITPDVHMPEDKVVRTLDRSALTRVFSNLLNNAIKYSDGDLDITLSGEGEIVFSNTASGLDEVQVGRLFDRFYTVEAARKSTGLGLAIARTLVEQMDGTISARLYDNKLSICIFLPGAME